MLKHLSTNIDHIEMAEKYHNRKCLSVIVFCKHLSESLYNNNQHMIKKNNLIISSITEQAINKLNNKWFTTEQILKFFHDYNISTEEITEENNTTYKTVILDSEITEQAKSKLQTKWFTHDEITKVLLPKYSINTWATSASDIQENKDFMLEIFNEITKTQIKIMEFQIWEQHCKNNTQNISMLLPRTTKIPCLEKPNKDNNQKMFNRMVDEVYQAQIRMLEFNLLENHKTACKYKCDQETNEYIVDENDDLIELSIEDWNSTWDLEILNLTMPRSRIEYNRVYTHMPEPYCHWDYRNFWQQYFFVQDDDCDLYACGGTGSSSQREINGLMTHVFATITQKYNKDIPTLIYVYDENNNLKLLDCYKTFKTLPRELNGNYKHADVNNQTIRTLFNNLLINYNKTDNDFELYDYQFK